MMCPGSRGGPPRGQDPPPPAPPPPVAPWLWQASGAARALQGQQNLRVHSRGAKGEGRPSPVSPSAPGLSILTTESTATRSAVADSSCCECHHAPHGTPTPCCTVDEGHGDPEATVTAAMCPRQTGPYLSHEIHVTGEVQGPVLSHLLRGRGGWDSDPGAQAHPRATGHGCWHDPAVTAWLYPHDSFSLVYWVTSVSVLQAREGQSSAATALLPLVWSNRALFPAQE